MQWRNKLPVATRALGSYWERDEYSLTYLSFDSFDAPYHPVRLMYEKRTATIQFLILCLMVPKIWYFWKFVDNSLLTPPHPLLEKNVFPPGLEPRTFRVLGERDNHYTTETTNNDPEFICIISETAMVQYLRHAKIESFWSGSHILRPYPCIRNLKYKLWRPPINENPVYCARCQVAGWPNRHV